MSRLYRPSDRLIPPNLLTKIKVGKSLLLTSPPSPDVPYGSLPFQIYVGEAGQVTCDFQPQGIVVTNPYNFSILFPDVNTWVPPYFANYAIPYAPYPASIIHFNASANPSGQSQGPSSSIAGPANAIITTDLSQYQGSSGSITPPVATPWGSSVSGTFTTAWSESGWNEEGMPQPNNHVIITNDLNITNNTILVGFSNGNPNDVIQIGSVAYNAIVDFGSISLPQGWDIYLATPSGTGVGAILVAVY